MEADLPRTAAVSRLYYGWVIVVSLGLAGGVVVIMSGVNFGLFIKPMGDELGIRNSFFGWAQTARLIGFAGSGFLIGRMLDRYGARVPLAIASVLLGAIVIALSFIGGGWQMVGIFLLIGVIGMQGGSSNLFTNIPLAKWFARKRGKAMSIAMLGTLAGFAVSAPLTQLLIDHLGWRDTWRVLGIGGSVAIVVIALALVRRQPEDMGLLPDGDSPDEAAYGGAASLGRPTSRGKMVSEYSWTRAQALRSQTFWRLSIVFGMCMLGTSTIGLFRVPYFIEEGISPQIVAFGLSLEAIVGASVAIPTGMAMDRFPPKYIAVGGFACMIGSIFVAIIVTSVWQVFLSHALFGVGIVSLMILQNAMWPSYFGSAHLGSIRGIAMPVTFTFSAIGAPATGLIKDLTGSYVPAWWAGIAALTLGAILMLITSKPQLPVDAPRPQEEQSTS
jgi:MFS family permease